MHEGSILVHFTELEDVSCDIHDRFSSVVVAVLPATVEPFYIVATGGE